VTGDCHAGICGSLGARFPQATRPSNRKAGPITGSPGVANNGSPTGFDRRAGIIGVAAEPGIDDTQFTELHWCGTIGSYSP
jgi:hypothetical protein